MKTKHVIEICIFVAVCTGLGFAYKAIQQTMARRSICSKCNIVLIDIDILRADELPCYGYTRNVAPNLCRFAKEAVVFRNNFSQSFWTLPSIFSTLTSLYPSSHNVREELSDRLADSISTLAQILRTHSYRTLYMGDRRPATITDQNGGTKGYEVAVDDIDPDHWLLKLAELQKTRLPFFLHVYTYTLHMPYLLKEDEQPIAQIPKPAGLPIVWEEFDREFAKYLTLHAREVFSKDAIGSHPEIFANTSASNTKILDFFNELDWSFDRKNLLQAWQPVYNAYMGHVDTHNPNDVAYLRMMYDTKIFYLDKQLQKFLAYLASSALARNTIVIISSSHGEGFGEHGVFSHDSSAYNELLHTPLIMKIPGVGSKEIDSMSQNIDIFPTLLETVGVPLQNKLQGASLVPLIKDQGLLDYRYAISETSGDAVIQDRFWKLIVKNIRTSSFPDMELYDLIVDPGETVNVVGVHEERAKKYLSILRNTLFESGTQNSGASPSMSPEKRKKLIKEGYF